MATLTVEQVVAAGMTPTANTAGATTDDCINNGETKLRFINSSGANAYTIDITSSKTVPVPGGTLAVADQVVSLAATVGAVEYAGPFPVDTFGSTLSWAYTGSAPATDITVEVVSG